MLRFLCLVIFCLSFHVIKGDDDTSSLPLEEICSSTECYKVVKKLGEGAFGVVYAVEDSNGQSLAIKSYKITDYSFTLLADAEREFERGQLFNHPNIVKSLDIFNSISPNQEMTWYLVLELIRGETIFDVQKKSLSRRQSLKASLQLVEALRYAWSLGMMHIDLHPGNIMLDYKGNIKVIDLASFFTIKDLMGETNEILESETLDKVSLTALKTQIKSQNMLGKNVDPTIQLVPTKDNKLKKFFRENPEVFNNLKQFLEKNKKTDKSKLNLLRFAPNLKGFGRELSPSSSETSSYESVQPNLFWECFYFQRITEICLDLIMKSNLSREKKFDLCADIKKLEWYYQDITDDGETVFLDDYLQKLLKLLK